MTLAGTKAGHQHQSNEGIERQIRNDAGLVVVVPAEAGIEGNRLDQKQPHQHQAHHQTIVVVNAKQLDLLFVACARFRVGRGVGHVAGCHGSRCFGCRGVGANRRLPRES